MLRIWVFCDMISLLCDKNGYFWRDLCLIVCGKYYFIFARTGFFIAGIRNFWQNVVDFGNNWVFFAMNRLILD